NIVRVFLPLSKGDYTGENNSVPEQTTSVGLAERETQLAKRAICFPKRSSLLPSSVQSFSLLLNPRLQKGFRKWKEKYLIFTLSDTDYQHRA
ncbi:hypothetical protein A2U01_0032848, partial [Trifolium medium]|nr:hypothetical protein [Trifolium medium]